MNDYLGAFVREGEAHVADLTDALLELESDPGNEEAMDAVFRSAHTLKGNFSAMGFDAASDLTHALEDLLEAMRKGDLAVTNDRMDRIFEGVDTIEGCLADIETTGEVQRDVSTTVANVRAVLDETETNAQTVSDTETVAGPDATESSTDSGTGDGRPSSDLAPESTFPSTDTEIQSVCVDVDQVDELHGLVERLVTTRIRLRRGVDDADRPVDDALDDALEELDELSRSLQDTVMDMRLVPVQEVVEKFPRLVRDLAREQDKEVEFVVDGEDVEVDRSLLGEISDPLLHLLRNAVDHGIEPPEVREARGKDPEGTVTLSVERARDKIVIEVRDDGGGIDRKRIREQARERDITSEAELTELSDSAVQDLVFHPGLSTNDEVTDISGRGVGLDVVRDTVTGLNGSVSVSSVPDQGTTFTLTLPVSVGTVDVLFVESGREVYGIPTDSVDGISRMQGVEQVDGEETITSDETTSPLIRLDNALDGSGTTKNGDGMLVHIQDAERQFAVHCDDVRGREEVAVNQFESTPSGLPGVSGAAVLEEDNVVAILDVSTL